MPEIFINYRTGRGDENAAALLDHHLSGRFGSEKVFYASKSISPGQDFRDALSSASGTTKVLLVVMGPDWLKRDEHGEHPLEDEENWTRREILNALESGAHVIPILCGRKMPRLSKSELPRVLNGWPISNPGRSTAGTRTAASRTSPTRWPNWFRACATASQRRPLFRRRAHTMTSAEPWRGPRSKLEPCTKRASRTEER